MQDKSNNVTVSDTAQDSKLFDERMEGRFECEQRDSSLNLLKLGELSSRGAGLRGTSFTHPSSSRKKGKKDSYSQT